MTNTYWGASDVDKHVGIEAEGYWTRTGPNGEPIESGSSGGGGGGGSYCHSGDPSCSVQIQSAGCGNEWWNFGLQTGRVALAGGVVLATMRPPTFNPHPAAVAAFALEGAAWGKTRADLQRCI